MPFAFSKSESYERTCLIRNDSPANSLASEDLDDDVAEYCETRRDSTPESCSEYVAGERYLPDSNINISGVTKQDGDFADEKHLAYTQRCARSRTWNALLQTDTSSKGITSSKRRTWSPVVVELTEACLRFYGFLTSPPFMTIPLVWSHVLSAPKYHEVYNELLLTTKILEISKEKTGDRFGQKSDRGFPDFRRRRRRGEKVAKIACADHGVLLDLVDAVQRCIFSFPVFRHKGIAHRKQKVQIDVHGSYRANQKQELGAEIEAINEISVRVKIAVSDSPECILAVDRTDTTLSEVQYHKWVRQLESGACTCHFLPLDNNWFEPVRVVSILDQPAPLRCELSIDYQTAGRVEFCTRLVLASTARLEYKSVRNIVLRLPMDCLHECDPSELLRNANTTRGDVYYNCSTRQLVWCIKKLRINQNMVKHLGRPIASLSARCDTPYHDAVADQVFKARTAELSFTVQGRTVACDINIAEIMLGSQRFDNFRISRSNLFCINIPVSIVQ